MNKTKWTALVAVLGLLLSLCLCACTDTGGDEQSTVATSRTTRTTRRVIDVQIESLITHDQLEELLSVPMQKPQVTHNGTHLFALSENGLLSVQIALDTQTAEQFEKLVGDTSEAESARNLGQQAWWLPQKRMLLVYEGNYTLSVSLAFEEYSDDDAFFVSRQLAVQILDRLAA